MSTNNNLMDIEIGGEQTQYEGVHTFVDPHEKLAGTMGGRPFTSPSLPRPPTPPNRPFYIQTPNANNQTLTLNSPQGSQPHTTTLLKSTSTSSTRQHDPSHPLSHHVSGAENAQFARTMREGMGGMTTGVLGEARVEGGFGGTAAIHDEGDNEAKERREQGYGGKHDMDRNIGA